MIDGVVRLAVLLIVGLSSCGPVPSESIEIPVHDSPTGQTTIVIPSLRNSRLETHEHPTLQQTLPSVQDRQRTDGCLKPLASPDAVRPDLLEPDPAVVLSQQWLAEAWNHPEVTVRRQALEVWAAQPNQDLDPLTYALVDEDESIRMRAQALYEQQSTWETTAAQQPTVSGDAGDLWHHAE